MPTSLPRRCAGVLAGGALALTACGGASPDAGPTTTAPPAAPSSLAPVATPTPVVAALDKTFWYGGFQVALTKAEWLQRNGNATVTLSLGLRNLRDEADTLDHRDLSLTLNGKSTAVGLNDLPEVPGKAKNDGSVTFVVEDTFAIEGATLTWGAPNSNQAVVPLGAGAPTTYQPKATAAAGALTTKQAKTVVSPGVLDASWASGDKGKYVLRVPMEFTYLGTAPGGYYLDAKQYTLTLAGGDGVVSAPLVPHDLVADAALPNQPLSRFLSFKMSDPGEGPFTLTFKDSAGDLAKVTVTVT